MCTLYTAYIKLAVLTTCITGGKELNIENIRPTFNEADSAPNYFGLYNVQLQSNKPWLGKI
jgi:hypothetical protein